ncbi:MAG: bifunctional riboflavin kinase/FAD synthetase [Phototrophicales bacterium]|nr:bifunctional riboflavin kinase/FAD synthetase [Phototrophicales bacterium]
MSHIYDISNVHLLQASVITIGVFDGVHKGHQHLIKQLVKHAHSTGRLAVVLTFFPHPDIVLRGLEGRYYLTHPEQRAEYLLNLGVDYVVTHPFDEQTRHMRASDFVELLINHLHPQKLWVGEDFALGYKREGNVAFLQSAGEQKGFSVEVVDMIQSEIAGGVISSTLIRDALQRGDVARVREWLGRSYTLSGEVIHGMKRGRELGFPTANMAVWEGHIIPANGIYAGWATLNGERFMAMTNVGISPTFGYRGVTVESYLLDFDRDIYGEILYVTFEKFMRPEAKFDSLQALIDQMHRDCDGGREYLMGIKA